jgi:hypothetical protein
VKELGAVGEREREGSKERRREERRKETKK